MIALTYEVLQAAKDVVASKDVLAELFEHIGFFFQRLEAYTEATPTAAMTDIIIEIMVEVLKIFAIATKELKQGSASEFWTAYVWISTQVRVEKFLKRVTGRTDLEDAVKRLDRLTQEEARMALAEVLRLSRGVRDEVKVVDSKVERTSTKVDHIVEEVQRANENVQLVIDGTVLYSASHRYLLTFFFQKAKRRARRQRKQD